MVLNFHTVLIRVEDRERTYSNQPNDKKQFNDVLMAFWMAYLFREIPRHSRKSVEWWESYFVLDTPSRPYQIEKQRTEFPNFTLIPVNAREIHWLLCVVIMTQTLQEILVLDSLDVSGKCKFFDEVIANKIYRKLNEVAKRMGSNQTFSKKAMPFRFIPVTKQPNAFDCGVYTLINAETVLKAIEEGKKIDSVDFTKPFKEDDAVIYNGDFGPTEEKLILAQRKAIREVIDELAYRKSFLETSPDLKVTGAQFYELANLKDDKKSKQILKALKVPYPSLINVTRIPRGIKNSENKECLNACFLIALVQALYQTPTLNQYCLNNSHLSGGFTFTELLCSIFRKLQTKDNVDIRPLFKALTRVSTIVYLEQNDIGETLQILLQLLVQEIAIPNTVVDPLPFIPMVRTIQCDCKRCFETTSFPKREEILPLHLAFPPNKLITESPLQLEELIKMDMEKEKISSNNAVACCSRMCRGFLTTGTRSSKLDQQSLPPTLVLQLKRFNSEQQKIHHPVVYPSVLHFGDKIYGLYALVLHKGEYQSGHYTCFVKVYNQNGKLSSSLSKCSTFLGIRENWFDCDDHLITEVTEQQVLQERKNCYLFFYEEVQFEQKIQMDYQQEKEESSSEEVQHEHEPFNEAETERAYAAIAAKYEDLSANLRYLLPIETAKQSVRTRMMELHSEKERERNAEMAEEVNRKKRFKEIRSKRKICSQRAIGASQFQRPNQLPQNESNTGVSNKTIDLLSQVSLFLIWS